MLKLWKHAQTLFALQRMHLQNFHACVLLVCDCVAGAGNAEMLVLGIVHVQCPSLRPAEEQMLLWKWEE